MKAWWENESFRLRAGRLRLGARAATDLARRHGTPLFVYGRDRLLANYRTLASAFAAAAGGETRICYAMKANPHPGLLAILRREGAWIDAVSPGEVRAALEAGFPAGRVVYTGTSFSEDDFRRAFAVPGLVVTIDALEALDVMRRALGPGKRRKPVRIAVRWNPGVGCGFNPKVITAGGRTPDGTPIKFGVDEAKVLETYRKAAALGFVPVGLHQHLGSGWVGKDYPAAAESVERMARQARRIEAAGFRLEFLDFGGGFGPLYEPRQAPFPVGRYVRRIAAAVRRAGLGSRALALEPGKYLVADAGVLLLRIVYVKESGGCLFACVDGGTYNTLPRPAIYRARHGIVPAVRRPGSPVRPFTIAGHLCETGDVFARDVALPFPRPGDVLAVLNAGAYGRSMASHYNLRPIPKEIIV